VSVSASSLITSSFWTVSEKYGMSLEIDVAPANQHDTKTIVAAPRKFADGGFQRPGFPIPD
jgi:hypothetical protein